MAVLRGAIDGFVHPHGTSTTLGLGKRIKMFQDFTGNTSTTVL